MPAFVDPFTAYFGLWSMLQPWLDAVPWKAVLAALATSWVLFSAWLHVSAGMRGSRGARPPKWILLLLRIMFFLLFCSPFLWLAPWLAPLFALYLPSYMDGSELSGGRPNKSVVRWGIWRWLKRRFKLQLVGTAPLDPNKQYIFGLCPHGILPVGGMIAFLSPIAGRPRVLPGIEVRVLAASFVFSIPLYRDLALGAGVVDASRYNARAMLDEGKSLLLVPGGASEALYALPGTNTVLLRKRRGFVKLALQTGASLVPCYSFGENDAWNQVSADHTIINAIKRHFQLVFGISLPLLTSIIPRKCDITTVVGAAMEVPHIPDPTDDEVNEVLGQFIAALEDLFHAHKDKYAPNRKEDIKVV